MKAFFKDLPMGRTKLHLFFNRSRQPIVKAKGKNYFSISTLIQDFPQLNTPQESDKTAYLMNFLTKGLEFEYIEDISAFQKTYQAQIVSGKTDLLLNKPCLNDYGIFDISQMHHPKIIGGKLIFFVKHDYSQLPYRVFCDFPIQREEPRIGYELLPYV